MRPKASTEGRLLGAGKFHRLLLATDLPRATRPDGRRDEAEAWERFRSWHAEGWNEVVLAAYAAKQPIRDEWRWDREWTAR